MLPGLGDAGDRLFGTCRWAAVFQSSGLAKARFPF